MRNPHINAAASFSAEMCGKSGNFFGVKIIHVCCRHFFLKRKEVKMSKISYDFIKRCCERRAEKSCSFS